MLEALEKLLKEYKKNAQKTKVRAIGRSGVQSKELKKEKIIRLGEQESKRAQKSISKATTGLQDTVKGQFGKKVTEVFDKQKQTLDNF
ncbi:hypothetical protein IGL98_000938 [Enterococcus sp. DIV0840]|uniref:hypothetical protein n=1 Tax=unclassified Enterococcus TaxID=2608891 RepID=UPI001A8D3D46|nr:hypothetical protein [Enterococcus sp. DIV0849a]MBO0433664.1 hypothetical protein [Enterococcus sp. DIV0849a]